MAAARTIVGPPMSTFSIASSKRAALRDLVLERVEVHDHHVDRRRCRASRAPARCSGSVAAREDARRGSSGAASSRARRGSPGSPWPSRRRSPSTPAFSSSARGAAGREDLEAALRRGRARARRCRPCGTRTGALSWSWCLRSGGRRSSASARRRVLRGDDLAAAGMCVVSPLRVAPHGEPGRGRRGHRARVGERGDRPRGRAVVEAAVVDDAPVAEELGADRPAPASRLRSTSDCHSAGSSLARRASAPRGRRARPASCRGSRRRARSTRA